METMNLSIADSLYTKREVYDAVHATGIVKRELSNLDCYALRYVASHLEFNDEPLNIEDNSIQDNELYLAGFEGVNVYSDAYGCLLLKTLFISDRERIYASLWDIDKDIEFYALID